MQRFLMFFSFYRNGTSIVSEDLWFILVALRLPLALCVA